MWNAELPWKVARCTTLTLTFRIPHSEFRILGGAGVGMVRIIAGEFKGRRLKTPAGDAVRPTGDRKSTRLNSSHSQISYAVFCLKKKNTGQCLLHVSRVRHGDCRRKH